MLDARRPASALPLDRHAFDLFGSGTRHRYSDGSGAFAGIKKRCIKCSVFVCGYQHKSLPDHLAVLTAVTHGGVFKAVSDARTVHVDHGGFNQAVDFFRVLSGFDAGDLGNVDAFVTVVLLNLSQRLCAGWGVSEGAYGSECGEDGQGCEG
jgi:hypothetical protein